MGCCWSLQTVYAHFFQALSLALSETVGIFLEPRAEEVSLMLPETILGGCMTMLHTKLGRIEHPQVTHWILMRIGD